MNREIKEQRSKEPYVFVGGLGGSGTRVVARALQMLGVDLGYDLNIALDNLSYTLLVKRVEWFCKASDDDKLFALKLFFKTQIGASLSHVEEKYLKDSMEEMRVSGHSNKLEGAGDWATKRYAKIIAALKERKTIDLWGWKEPNSHLIAPLILEHFTATKYIYVIRHGLDMCLSKNQNQLHNWHDIFGLPSPTETTEREILALSLDFWIASAKRAYTLQKRFGRDVVHIICYEHFMERTNIEIEKLSHFLGIPKRVDSSLLDLTWPKSYRGSKDIDLSIFSTKQLKDMEQLGFIPY